VWGGTPPLVAALFRASSLPYQAWVGIALGVAALVVTLSGTLLGVAAEARARADKRSPQMAVTAVLIVIGVVAFFAVLTPVVVDSRVFA